MDLWSVALPVPVALAAVALVGYIFGRRNSKADLRSLALGGNRELCRAKSVIRELEGISQTMRRSLATHQASILNFKERLSHLPKDRQQADWQSLSEEAERILQPTLKLSAQIAHAYDEIRQQTNLLTSFGEVRTDPLTGLANRRAMEEMLTRMFAMQTRYDTVFAVAMVDIDEFKEINGQHGHLHGDHVLVRFARELEQTVRETDLLARYGGEEFVVIMPEADLAGSAAFAERLREKVARDLELTVSCGLAVGVAGDTIHSLLSRADAALYSAKSAGRNCSFRHTGHQIERISARTPEPACVSV
jgi:diguanylate cyclase (GGDEF)-like protein